MNARNVTAVARTQQSLAAFAAAAMLTLAPSAAAQQPKSNAFVPKYTGTLKKVAESRTIRIGHRENSPPFAFLDAKKTPIGYSLDLCEIVVEEVARELDGEIKVEFVPVTPENRFDMVTAGTVDLECGSTTNNAERRKTVAFSPTMFVTGTTLMVRRGSGIFHIGNLAGKTVVLTKGTVHETAVPKIAERRKIPVTFVFAPDHKQSFEMLAAGKADAFANATVSTVQLGLSREVTTARSAVNGMSAGRSTAAGSSCIGPTPEQSWSTAASSTSSRAHFPEPLLASVPSSRM
jgi:glutamate/aspartate transport system substrate-binding protein